MVREMSTPDVSRYADVFAAMGAEPRLQIMRLLLKAHPDGLVVGQLQHELGLAPSTMSHHLEKLRHEDLVAVEREGTFLRYRANTDTLREVLGFLYTECCGGTGVTPPEVIVRVARRSRS
jgi:DNA-binding transcriptional ArsR family regulator